MNEISKTTKKSIYTFCRKLTLGYPKNEFTMENTSYMCGHVPDEISIDRSNGNDFILYGEYYWLYDKVLAELRGELVLEYLKDQELKDAFWYFTCEIIAGYQAYKDSDELNKKIDVFLNDFSKPLEDYEILIPILNIDVKDSKFKFNGITIKKLEEHFLEEYGIKKDKNAFHMKFFNHIVNKTGAIILEKGNNPNLVHKRARRKADFVIRILQASLSTNINLHDKNLLFKQDEYSFIRKKGNSSSIGGHLGTRYKPIPIEINKDSENKINKFLSSIPEVLEEGKLPPKFRELFVRAFTWVGRAIEEEDSDIKIINLSTALETILTTQNDKRKGETLAYRMLLLNTFIDKPFIDPANVLWIYELRSNIIHGSKLGIASNYEYSTMLHVAMDALINSLEVIRIKNLKVHNKFIDILESDGKKDQILNFLMGQSDEWSFKIKKHMEEKL